MTSWSVQSDVANAWLEGSDVSTDWNSDDYILIGYVVGGYVFGSADEEEVWTEEASSGVTWT